MQPINLGWSSIQLAHGERRDRPLSAALAFSGAYGAIATAWILLSDRALLFGSLTQNEIVRASSIKGGLFVLVTASIVFFVTGHYLSLQRASEDRLLASQRDQLLVNERALRQGYVDVLDVVTGGRLVLMTEDELLGSLGEEILTPHDLSDPVELCDARHLVARVPQVFGLPERDAFVLAITEALTNALKHGRRAEYSACRTADAVQVVIRDFGPGIDFRMLPKATLIQGFSTTKTLGMGFTIMLEVCDRVLLATSASGTVVVLELRFVHEPAETAGAAPSLYGAWALDA